MFSMENLNKVLYDDATFKTFNGIAAGERFDNIGITKGIITRKVNDFFEPIPKCIYCGETDIGKITLYPIDGNPRNILYTNIELVCLACSPKQLSHYFVPVTKNYKVNVGYELFDNNVTVVRECLAEIKVKVIGSVTPNENRNNKIKLLDENIKNHIINVFENTMLNNVLEFNPTPELLTLFIWKTLSNKGVKGIDLVEYSEYDKHSCRQDITVSLNSRDMQIILENVMLSKEKLILTN